MSPTDNFKLADSTERSSVTVINIAGFHVYLYGVKELTPAQAKDVTVFFHIHGRGATHLHAEAVAHQLLVGWRARGSTTKGLVVATFDNRNHAERALGEITIQEWAEGNPRHAQDMLGMIDGAVDDINITTKYLPAYVDFEPTEYIVSGVSLGGHVSWNTLASEPKIQKAAIIVGSPDLTTMLEERLAAFKKVPVSSVKAFEFAEWNRATSRISRERDQSLASISGKTILILNGADDALVPSKFTRTWVDRYGSNNNSIEFHEQVGYGHGLSEGMMGRLTDWVVKNVGNGRKPIADRRGLFTTD